MMTVEEAKFYPHPDIEPLPLEPGELPASYGRNRLVLLPVDPYLLYAYWELAGDAPPTAGARPVLRFEETPGRPFDVEVDLAAGNWYVHLWSAGKSYRAELGVRSEDGAFVSLAHSNTVQTPIAGPAPQFSVPLPPEEPLAHGDEQPAPVKAPLPPSPPPVHVAALLQSRLAEIFAEIQTLTSLTGPFIETVDDIEFVATEAEDIIAEPIPFDLGDLEELDLTDYSEQRFSPGISSQGGALGE
jgi:hypothetical protein